MHTTHPITILILLTAGLTLSSLLFFSLLTKYSKTLKPLVLTSISVSVGAYFGAYVRILIDDSTSFWPNLLGCFLIGITAPINSWRSDGKTGFTTGFCGSLTTFSAWINTWSKNSLDDFPLHSQGYQAQIAVRNLLSFFGVFIIGYVFGRDCYEFCVAKLCSSKTSIWNSNQSETQENLEISQTPKTQKRSIQFWSYLTYFFIIIYLPVTGLIIWGMRAQWNGQVKCYALVLSQFGALLRWQLCDKLNRKEFCYGTVLSNTIAVLALTMSSRYADTSSFWIYGLNSGFCACLSTVSSMVKDSVSIYENLKVGNRKVMSVVYSGTTFGVAVLIGLLVWGV